MTQAFRSESRPRRAWRLALALGAVLAVGAGCGRREPPPLQSMSLAIDVSRDTGLSQVLRVAAPESVRVWVRSVSPTPPASIDAPLPGAAPDTLSGEPPPPPALAVDSGLKPPILRARGRLVVPSRSRARPASVELDVRVSERGDVTDALWAGGERDSALVAAARACALGMRFYPALKGGAPVAVWCRQRFDFAGR